VPHDKIEQNYVSPRILELICRETSKVKMEMGVHKTQINKNNILITHLITYLS
jgi:hypothetical protein